MKIYTIVDEEYTNYPEERIELTGTLEELMRELDTYFYVYEDRMKMESVYDPGEEGPYYTWWVILKIEEK